MEGNIERDPSSSSTNVMGSSDEGVDGETEWNLRCQGSWGGWRRTHPGEAAGGGIAQEQKPQVLSTFSVVCGQFHRLKGRRMKNFKIVPLEH